MDELSGLRVAVLATDGFEEAELTEPVQALRDAGATVSVVAPKAGAIQGFKNDEKTLQVKVDRTLADVTADDFDAIHLPGGALNADALRLLPEVHTLLWAMNDKHKPMSIICHAAWELISAEIVRGRTLTSYATIQDDIRNAGGVWVDQEVVADGNWITSRQPSDLPAFNRAMIALFSRSLQAVH